MMCGMLGKLLRRPQAHRPDPTGLDGNAFERPHLEREGKPWGPPATGQAPPPTREERP